MPQLEFAPYPSQIFWFIVCFVALYCFLAYVIIPRVASVIKNRKSIIDKDLSALEKLNHDISQIEERTSTVVLDADVKYKDSIADAVAKSREKKDDLYEEFKKKSDSLVEKSRKQVDDVIAASAVRSGEVATELGSFIGNKILN